MIQNDKTNHTSLSLIFSTQKNTYEPNFENEKLCKIERKKKTESENICKCCLL